MTVPYSTTGPLGQRRGIGFGILMYIITLSFYAWYWVFRTQEEIKEHSGIGVGGVLGLVIWVVAGFVTIFLIPSDIGKLYMTDLRGPSATVVDLRMNNRMTNIDLGGALGAVQYDPQTRRILMNVRSTNELAEIDPATDLVASRLKLSGGKTPHGLEIAPSARVAFVGCVDDAKLLVIDLDKWKVREEFVTAQAPDMLAFDEGLGMLYVGTESNNVSVFRLKGKDLDRLGDVEVGPNAHSVCVNSTTHEVYVPLENVNGKPTLRILAPPQQ